MKYSLFKQVIEIYDLLDRATVKGQDVLNLLKKRGLEDLSLQKITGEKGSTDFIKIKIPGREGKTLRRNAPTLGIIGRLGGIGARPERIGLVSDADGAVTALSCALKLADMKRNGDSLLGDVVVTTHICPNAPTQPHQPVPFMDSPVDMTIMNRQEVTPEMDALLSIDTTKGNRVAKFKGFAITPTVKEGYILRVSENLLDIMEVVTGRSPRVVPITLQDITPYGNDIYHINSIMQPWIATDAPIIGVAITAEVPVPGCGTGASNCVDIELASRFCIEVAKAYGARKCSFYNQAEFQRLVELYGSMSHLRRLSKDS
ncbi:MAG: DUF1177 domain-containing protein [Candidatus Bathyarchaeota archaeon]|nr:DUF1177 domain-containing protein [Candidatus Bathyarchaeota archaeon]